MRGILSGLLTSLVLLTSAVPVVRAATEAEPESKTEQATAVVTDAGPHRWVNEGGPVGAVVDSISLSASEPNVLYVLTNSGMHKTTDGAETWTRMGWPHPEGGGWGRPGLILVDPTNADTLYAYGNGFLKSTDGGVTWVGTPGTEEWRRARELTMGTGKTKALYVLLEERTVMRSTDAGKTWEKCLDDSSVSRVCHLMADPHAPGTLYAIMVGSRAVFTSGDGGTTWRQTAGKLRGVSVKACERFDDDPQHFKVTLVCNGKECAIETTNQGRWWKSSDKPWRVHPGGLDVDADDPQKLQLTVDSQAQGEVLMTRDEAVTWKVLELPFVSWDLQAIGFSATQEDVLYMGSIDGYGNADYSFSDDAGETWDYFYSTKDDPDGLQTAAIKELTATFPCLFRTRRKTLALAPLVDLSHPEIAYVRDGRGVSKTVDGGATWSPANRGLSAIMILDIAADPKTPGLVYAAGAGGVHKSDDNAKTWRLVCGSQKARFPHGFPLYDSPDRACALVAVHPLAPQVVLSAGPRVGACISTDAGETWREISAIPRDSYVHSFLFDPKIAARFYVLTKESIWETADAGGTWQARAKWKAEGPKDHHDDSWGIIPPGNTSVIYRIKDGTSLTRSTDIGKTWELLDLPSSQGYILARPDPRNPRTIIVRTEDGGLLLSADAGETWSSIKTECFSTCIEPQPGDPSTFYIGDRNNCVLRTRDGGKTFERFGEGMPKATISCIAVSPVDGTVYAGTWNAGVYRLVIEKQTEPDKSEE